MKSEAKEVWKEEREKRPGINMEKESFIEEAQFGLTVKQ